MLNVIRVIKKFAENMQSHVDAFVRGINIQKRISRFNKHVNTVSADLKPSLTLFSELKEFSIDAGVIIGIITAIMKFFHLM